MTDRIESRPEVCGGEACVRGTRVMVWPLVSRMRQGSSDADLLSDYPTLAAADLDAAWDYYRAHPVEIEGELWLNDVAANHPPGEPVPPGLLVEGQRLGVSRDKLREAFDPPLSDAALGAECR